MKCRCDESTIAVMERLDKLDERLDTIEKNQLVAKVTVSVLMGCSLVLAWFIDHANLLSDLFSTKPKDQ